MANFRIQTQVGQDGLVATPMRELRVRRGSGLGMGQFFEEGSGFTIGS